MKTLKPVVVGISTGLLIGLLSLITVRSVLTILFATPLPIAQWLPVLLAVGAVVGGISGGLCRVLSGYEQLLLGLLISAGVAATAVLSGMINPIGWQPLGIYGLALLTGLIVTPVACLIGQHFQSDILPHPELGR